MSFRKGSNMRKLYDDNRPILFRPERWSVTEDVFDEGTNRVRESVFAVANGYIGVRGFLKRALTARRSTPIRRSC